MPKVRMLDVKNRRVIDPALELARKDAVILELQEAAEFEARVAAKLASSSACQYVTGHCMLAGCAACQLRDARLAVEEEMDANGK